MKTTIGVQILNDVRQFNLMATVSLTGLLACLLSACGADSNPISNFDPSEERIVEINATPTVDTSSPTAPDFHLPDKSGSMVSLSGLLAENHSVVLVFFRGHF